MRVRLISHTSNPEKIVAAAARLCYSPVGIDNILEKMSDEEANRLVEKVVSMGHLSTLEHASFTFGVEGISRACSHQLVRHRIASYSQQSQRYVKMRDAQPVIPNSIKNKPEALDKFNEAVEKISASYDELLNMGITAEDARYLLPNAAPTNILITMNARSLLNFFQLRLCTRAQTEIRELAAQMLEEATKAAPVIFSYAGAICETKGYCDQGNMSCGRKPALKKKK